MSNTNRSYIKWKQSRIAMGIPKKDLTKKKYMQYVRFHDREKKMAKRFLRTIHLSWDML